MDIQNNISFQGRVPEREKRNNTKWAIIGAPLITAVNIGQEAFLNKGLRADTFGKTAENCIKAHTKMYKESVAWIAKNVLRNDKWAEQIFKLKHNKYLAGAAITADMLLMGTISKLTTDAISHFKHRKD